jgi:DNA polymerase-1
LLAKLPVSEIEPPICRSPEVVAINPEIIYRTVNTRADLEALVNRLAGTSSLAFSIEGSDLNPMNAQLVGLALSPKDGEAYYIPLSQPGFFNDGHLSRIEALATLKPVLENPASEKIIHNSKYGLVLLSENATDIPNFEFDTMLAAYLLGDKSLGLNELVFARTGREITPSKDLTGKGSKQISLFQVDVTEVAAFACANADMTGRLA